MMCLSTKESPLEKTTLCRDASTKKAKTTQKSSAESGVFITQTMEEADNKETINVYILPFIHVNQFMSQLI